MDSFSDSSEAVLNDLDPLSRALLDLSMQRGMDDAEIAEVLGTDEASVFEVRVGLLRNLAEKVAPEHAEADLPELESAVAGRLYADEAAIEGDDLGDEVDGAELELEGEPETEAELDAEPELKGEPETDAELDAEPETEAEPQPTPAATAPTRRRRAPLVVLLPLLLLATIAALIIALTSGGDDNSAPKKPQPAAQQQPTQTPKPAKPKPKPTRLTALGSGTATGTATVNGDRVTLKVRNLPDPQGGVYTVWLYNSIIDAKPLKNLKNDKATITLPANAKKYQFLDVSLEPRDGNPNHSGQSVLRVPLRTLVS